MTHKIEFYKRFFFTLMLAVVTLSSLPLIIGFIYPAQAAAQNLISNPKGSSYQDPLAVIASPPESFIQASSLVTPIYLPLIFKNPVVAYFDDFGNSDSGWADADDGKGCTSLYDSGRYRLNIDQDITCIPRNAPVGSAAERTYGEFETAVYHSSENESDGVSNAVFGIFTNGNGGGYYYIFKIRPNISGCSGGGWEFIRRVNSVETSLIKVNCTSVVTRGFGSGAINTLRLKHGTNGVITLYINNQSVYSINESSSGTGKELTGRATGVYAESATDEASVIKYDYFKVYAP